MFAYYSACSIQQKEKSPNLHTPTRYVSVFWFSVPVCQPYPANRIDELYYKGMRLRRDAAARASTEKSARRAQRKRGNKKGTTKRPSLGRVCPTRRAGDERE
jgi:hypothetical protein